MSDDTYTFDQARARLEDIAKQTKGASLEKCLDLLEEGVKLANVCTEKIDHTRWRDEVSSDDASTEPAEGATSESAEGAAEVESPAEDVRADAEESLDQAVESGGSDETDPDDLADEAPSGADEDDPVEDVDPAQDTETQE